MEKAVAGEITVKRNIRRKSGAAAAGPTSRIRCRPTARTRRGLSIGWIDASNQQSAAARVEKHRCLE
jgi:hypothetical protein